ncbi:3-isopropylmalate dehydratase [Hondaea fermentalgiana]|uniref:3-isopropylmalate dehydratase n=1 Tax=Hondaea fermentalgiana TaxID=2315210 RepID=A0A2R5GRQ7_9STRA|nr:3-isopropylmalate dehydratase [Hondaea fermentalgiana]|eukprot:GBG33562.1 3-isopropylmalate dehydratase [Hondaea fermentalgiana]
MVATVMSGAAKRVALAARSSGQAQRVARLSASAGAASGRPRTLYEKIWDDHVIHTQEDGTCLIGIDRMMIHEVTSPQAFEGLRLAGRKIRQPQRLLCTPDHNVPTGKERLDGQLGESPESLLQVETLDENAKRYQLPYFALNDKRQGIVHVVALEQGFTLPGCTMVCGDSHTSTHGAFGSLAFGIGTSEVEHVLATQTLIQSKAKSMRITVNGSLPFGVTSKDLILHIIGVIGTAGGNGHVVEYAGEAVRGLSMEGRATLCNMSIEQGSRAGLVAPDDTTFRYLKNRPMAPTGEVWDKAVEYWRTLPSDEGATYDKEVVVNAADIAPQVTWGTNPEMVAPIFGKVPNPADAETEDQRNAMTRALEYMGLEAGQDLDGVPVDKIFVGSCTNGRIEDLRAVAEVVKGKKVADNIKHAMIVPGSGLVKRMAVDEGLDAVFREAGFDFREPGCSMCLGMNADQLEPGERCASTSNRNFEGRQGVGGRTHLVSPAMAAAAAITGRLTDVRNLMKPPGQQTRAFSSAPAAQKPQGAGMEPFTVLEGVAAPLPRPNIDTDIIIPARFLKTIKRSGLGKHAFSALRYTDGNSVENPDFVLNKDEYRGAKVLVAGDNFGCGSSREHAPWSLLDLGLRCVISTSFSDIFFNNCFKNGILPIVLPQSDVDVLMAAAKKVENFTVDLEAQTITCAGGDKISFDVDPFRKHCLLNGLDDIGLTLQKEDAIKAYEDRISVERPWI